MKAAPLFPVGDDLRFHALVGRPELEPQLEQELKGMLPGSIMHGEAKCKPTDPLVLSQVLVAAFLFRAGHADIPRADGGSASIDAAQYVPQRDAVFIRGLWRCEGPKNVRLFCRLTQVKV